MPLDTVRDHPDLSADLKDDLQDIKGATFRRYVSSWVRILPSTSQSFAHGLGDFPHVVDVQQATDAQGSSMVVAADVTTTKTATSVSVTRGAVTGGLFYRVRAF
mgnify:CR=1 FL=1